MIDACLTELFAMVKEWFKKSQIEIKNKPTLEVVKDKKELKKASNITEDILLLTDKYYHLFDKSDQRKYNRLKKKFNKKD